MPLVFAAAMGGNLSLIGAPGNLIAQSALKNINLSFGFFEYAIVGLPILIAGIIFYATIGFKILPNKEAPADDDSVYDQQQDFSNVPKWKQILSLVILVLTLLGMIFEEQTGIKLCIAGCLGALALIVTGVISEKEALKAIDLKTIFLFGGTLSLAAALEKTGAGELIDDKVIVALGSLSCLGYGPLANVTIIGMQFLDFFDFLTNSVMMPIAAIMICLLVSRAAGIKAVEAEVLHGEGTFRRKKIFCVMIKYICPIFAAIILISSVANAFGWISM